jgi:NAD-dependent deacetylase
MGFAADPALVWRFYSARRDAAEAASPNAAHLALAAVEERLGERFLLATQNVDGLHGRAGSRRLLEIHGSLFRTRCSRCSLTPFEDRSRHPAPPLPTCDACAGRGRTAYLRPDIVWFGEGLDPAILDAIETFITAGPGRRLVFLAVGTSGRVWPAAGFVHAAAAAGGETWLVNLDPTEGDDDFARVIHGAAGEVLPTLLGVG